MKRRCKHYNFLLSAKDRHFVYSEKYNNCVLCVSEHEGPLTQEKISEYMGLTKMRISQIEKEAIERFKKRMMLITKKNPLH